MSQGIDRFSDSGRVWDFVYPIEPSDKSRVTKLHAVRDASAAMQVLPSVLDEGYRYAGPIFNRYPGPRRRRRRGEDEEQEPAIVPVDYSFLRAQDLLLQACRPPIDDHRSQSKKRVPRSWTDLEQLLFDAWSLYLEYCARDKVCLARRFSGLLRKGFANRRDMGFHQVGYGATYLELLGRPAQVGDRTALFLLRLEEAWPGGPGYLCFFGQDGVSGYIWAHRLAHDFNFLLKRPGFAVAELEVQKIPKHPLTMDWCLKWKIELMLVHELGSTTRCAANA